MGKKLWNRKKALKTLSLENYHLVDDILEINSRTPINTKCSRGHDFNTNMYKFTVHNHRCRVCKNIEKEKESIIFSNTVEKQSNMEIKVLGKYKSKLQPVEIVHVKCGYKWGVLPKEFLKDIRCTKCNPNNQKKTHNSFVEEISKLYQDEYSVLSQYESNRKHVYMRHNECGHEWLVEPRNFTINKTGCPKCKMSKGEKKIERYFKSKMIDYKCQHKFKDCKNKNVLPFDFLVGDLLIEYDGQMHFEEGRFSKDMRKMQHKLIQTQKNDKIKNTYCINNKLSLIRIPFWEYENLEYILENALGYFGIIKHQKFNEKIVHKYLVNHSNWDYDNYLKQIKLIHRTPQNSAS